MDVTHSLPAICGLPQGSVLGPLLFISYINVTTVASSDSDLNLFADDIVLYRVIKNPADFDQLQSDINSVSSGSTCNSMLVNIYYKEQETMERGKERKERLV